MTVLATKGPAGRMGKKVSCEECFFRCNLLCSLEQDEPCATFRPNHPEGLRPPQQLRFTFRQERRAKAAWAFPTAQEQAARLPVQRRLLLGVPHRPGAGGAAPVAAPSA